MRGCPEGSPIRVLRVIARLNMGGPALHVTYLARGLAQRGYETTLVAGDVARGEESMAFVADLVVIDHRSGTVKLVANALADGTDDADALWQDAQRRLDRMQDRLARPSEAWLAEASTAVRMQTMQRLTVTLREQLQAARHRAELGEEEEA